jgi:hypothetical protein
MKKLSILAGVISVLTVYALLFSTSKDAANHNAAIDAVKKTYAPSPELLSLRPDFIEAQWTAHKYPRTLDGYTEAYEVTLSLDVIPDDDRKMLKAEWLVYAGNTKYVADDMEAQTLFVKR